MQPGGGSGSDDLQNAADYSRDRMFGASNGVSSNTQGTQAAATYSAETNKLDSRELEMILGAYFVQTCGILNKLFTVCNFIYFVSLFDTGFILLWPYFSGKNILKNNIISGSTA